MHACIHPSSCRLVQTNWSASAQLLATNKLDHAPCYLANKNERNLATLTRHLPSHSLVAYSSSKQVMSSILHAVGQVFSGHGDHSEKNSNVHTVVHDDVKVESTINIATQSKASLTHVQGKMHDLMAKLGISFTRLASDHLCKMQCFSRFDACTNRWIRTASYEQDLRSCAEQYREDRSRHSSRATAFTWRGSSTIDSHRTWLQR